MLRVRPRLSERALVPTAACCGVFKRRFDARAVAQMLVSSSELEVDFEKLLVRRRIPFVSPQPK